MGHLTNCLRSTEDNKQEPDFGLATEPKKLNCGELVSVKRR